MWKLDPNYDPSTATSILVPKIGHTISGSEGVVARTPTTGFESVEQLVKRDLNELKRVYPEIPETKLKEIVEQTKIGYPNTFKDWDLLWVQNSL